MNTIYRKVAVTAAIWMLASVTGWAQSSGGVPVAVVDIGEVFKSHPRFNQQIQALREKVKAYEQSLQQQAQTLKQQRDAMSSTFKPGTTQYKQKEEELARQQAQMTTEAQLRRKDFLEQEAKVYYDTYQEVQGVVAQFAQKWRIGLVLRFSRVDMKIEDQNSILQGVNRPVVYYDSSLDITDHIVNAIGGTAKAPARGGDTSR